MFRLDRPMADSRYPITDSFNAAVNNACDELDIADVPEHIRLMSECLSEYEHGSVDVTDVHPNMTLQMYFEVASDLAMAILYAQNT
jgi:hypothetical protein